MRKRSVLVAIILGIILGIILSFVLVGSAGAHSVLVSSNPASGAKVATAPANVQMTFSEGVEPAFSSFIVIDRTRKHFEVGSPTIDRVGGVVTVPLQPNLAPGDYVMQWKVVSVVDGHLTRGSFAFNVQAAPGAPTATPNLTPASVPPVAGGATAEPTADSLDSLLPSDGDDPSGESNAPGVLDVAVRWLDTLLIAVLVGGAVFSFFIVPGALSQFTEGPAERADIRKRLNARFIYGGLIAAVLLLVAQGAELVLQAMRATESDFGTVFSQQGVLQAVLDSSFGASIQWKLVAIAAIVAVLLAALVTKQTSRWLWALVVLFGAGYFWAQTGSAHATALSEEPTAGILQKVAPFSNLLHLLTTAIWIGGIFYFVGILLPVLRGREPKSRGAVLRESITRFSQLALVTVPVIALSGTIIYLAEQPSVDSTLSTGYGREVLVKVGLLAVLMIPAAYNLRKVGPGLAKLRDLISPAFQALAQGFRRSIRVEALLVSVVVVFSALLTLSAPATDPSAYAGAATPVAVAVVEPTATSVPVAPPTPEATATEVPPSTLALSQTVLGVDVSLVITHSIIEDELHVALVGPKGPISACGPTPGPDDDCAMSVKLTLTEISDSASNTVDAPADPNGGFTVPAGPYLPFDDTWQVVVAVRRYNQPVDLKAAYRYVIDETGMTGKISDYLNVDVTTNPDPPRSGPVDLTFHLTDSNGNPVNDATVVVQGLMPTHGHVTELTPMNNASGTYTANLLMPMSGAWSVELQISRPGHDTIADEISLDLENSDFDLTPYPSPNTTPLVP